MRIILHDVSIKSLITTKKTGNILDRAKFEASSEADDLLTLTLDMTDRVFMIDNQFEAGKEFLRITTPDSSIQLQTIDYTYVSIE